MNHSYHMRPDVAAAIIVLGFTGGIGTCATGYALGASLGWLYFELPDSISMNPTTVHLIEAAALLVVLAILVLGFWLTRKPAKPDPDGYDLPPEDPFGVDGEDRDTRRPEHFK
jgi:hypothetical protein